MSLIGIVVLLVALIIMKFQHESALKLLNDKQKASLIDGFSNHRKYGLLFLLVALLGGYWFTANLSEDQTVSAIIRSGVLLTAIFGYFYIADRGMRKLDLPAKYLSKWRLGLFIFAIGFLLMELASYFDAVFLKSVITEL